MEKEIKVEIPSVPNFIMVGKNNISIADFTNEELTEIGKEWILKLIETAEKKRLIN